MKILNRYKASKIPGSRQEFFILQQPGIFNITELFLFYL